MRIKRTLPPAAAPLTLRDILSGLSGLWRGPGEVQRFSGELQAFFNSRHCFPVSSGKAALCLILSALKELHPERDQVLIPAYTCYSVPSAVVRAGLKVTLCDIDPATLDFHMEQLPEKLADPALLCVVPVHLFGLPADVVRLRAMVTDPAVAVVEDAAQAMGGEHGGAKLGTLGHVGFFSLGRGKALSAVEGGVVLTSRDDLGAVLARRYAKLKEYAAPQNLALLIYALALWLMARPNLFWLPKALPFLRLGETIFDPDFPMRRMGGLQAGLARNWQKKLAAFQTIRRAAVQQWQAALPAARVSGLQNSPLLRYPIFLDSAAQARAVVRQSDREGLGIAPGYPDALHRVPALASGFSGQEYPVATDAAQRLVTLPVHGYVRQKDREAILALLRSVEQPQGEGG